MPGSDDNERLRAILDEMRELPGFEDITRIEITTRGTLGDTPLHVAAIRGDAEAGRILVSAGADVNAKGEHGYTPLHEAIQQEMPEFVRILLEAGAAVNIKSDDGFTSYEFAHLSQNAEIRGYFGIN